MKLFPALILAALIALLGGCANVTKPYDALDATVRGDTVAVNTGATAILDGVPANPYGNDLYALERGFQLTLPSLEQIAEASAAGTLDASAVTKLMLDADIASLNYAILALHNAIVGSVTAQIEVQHRAVMQAKKK